jgi:UDP-N-acetylmuramyl pentapeptide synthase
MSPNARWARLRRRFPLARLGERLATPEGRLMLAAPLSWLFWPLLAPLAALARRTWRRRVTVVAVTGSFGKTTTTRAIRAALDLPPRDGRIWNFGIALAWALLRAPGGRRLVVEVGISAPGQMRGYARMLRPDVVVVTSIGREHVGALGDLDGVAREKGELVAGARPGATVVVDGDDPRVAALATRLAGANEVRCGLGGGNDLRAEAIRLDWPPATRFDLVADGARRPVRLRLVGEPMARATLYALAVARALGVGLDAAIGRLERLAPTPGRLEPRPQAGGAWILSDEFKAGTETVDRALEALAALPAKRRLVVIGQVEEAPKPMRAYYRELGRRIGGIAARVVVVGEAADAVRSGLRAAGVAPEAIASCREVFDVPAALGPLGDGDLVLVKGRIDQKLERAVRRIEGLPVGCRLVRCPLSAMRCTDCPALLRAPRAGTARPRA